MKSVVGRGSGCVCRAYECVKVMRVRPCSVERKPENGSRSGGMLPVCCSSRQGDFSTYSSDRSG